jgi:hypothetical protein
MTEHDARNRIVVSWLREDGHENAERVLISTLNEIDHTPQRRSWWPAWRIDPVNTYAKVAIGVAAVAVVAVAGFNLLPRSTGPGAAAPSPTNTLTTPSPSPSPSSTPEATASLVAYTFTPFKPGAVDGDDDPRDDAMTFAFTAPPSWKPFGELGVFGPDGNGPDESYVGFSAAGNSLYSDPCRTIQEEADLDEALSTGGPAGADISFGPTVDDLATALVDHQSLDVTVPVDVTLAGYTGKYVDLTIPDDISECANYRPMDVGHHYAQGPGQRWHMWILDVDGVRVLVETNDFPGTPPETLAEAQAIIESLVISP